jgi:hypothetical protein
MRYSPEYTLNATLFGLLFHERIEPDKFDIGTIGVAIVNMVDAGDVRDTQGASDNGQWGRH